MANQWGRDSDFRSGGKGGSGRLTAIAMIVCLALGAAAGGYGSFRYLQPQEVNGVALDEASMEATGLREALEVARQELTEARADDAASAAKLEALEAQVARQTADLDAMTQTLAAISSDVEGSTSESGSIQALTRERDVLAEENQILKANVATLEAGLDAVSRDASAAEARVATELERLETEVLPQLTADRDRLQRKTLMMLADQSNLKARAKAAAEAHFVDAKRISELEARLAEAERELSASQEVLDGLKLERRASEAPDVAADNQKAEAAKTADTPATAALDPRRPDAVTRAVRIAPGLDTLTDADRQRLTGDLVAGECVTTALKSVFERVPILALRNLIRDLNSDC